MTSQSDRRRKGHGSHGRYPRRDDEWQSNGRSDDHENGGVWERDLNEPSDREDAPRQTDNRNQRNLHREKEHHSRNEPDLDRDMHLGRFNKEQNEAEETRRRGSRADNDLEKSKDNLNGRKDPEHGKIYGEIDTETRRPRLEKEHPSFNERNRGESVGNRRETHLESNVPEANSDLPGRTGHSQHVEGSLRRQRHSVHGRRPQSLLTIYDFKEDPPLPPPPSRHPSKPVPHDLPVEKRQTQYEYYEDHKYVKPNSRLSTKKYPTDDRGYIQNIGKHENKGRAVVQGNGSQLNLVSAETFGHSLYSRQGDFHHYRPSEPYAPQGHSRVLHHSDRDSQHIQNQSDIYIGVKHYQGVQEDASANEELVTGEPLQHRMAHRGSKPLAKGHGSYVILREENDTINRTASVLLPVLEDSERIFHELVASGDVNATRMFLHNHPDFNINCVNYLKISALHVAVKQQNELMVEFLLEQKGIDISDCALYAIKGGNIKIVEMIFDKIREKSPGLEFAGTTHSVDFADDLTPLILAAQLGNYEMIDFLIKRGHTIPPVHPPFCKCEACKSDLKKYDRLKYSTMKLNLYKAICNPMYIFHTRDDPFQRAFELTKELQDAATVFPQFKVSFQELWINLRTFTVELIGCCRNSQEVEIILKKSPRSVADHVKFPRLQYAIDLKQKEFVSHPYTQAVLSDAWTGELLEWKIRSPLMQSLSVFPRIPMLPVMTILCIFLPNHKLVRKWKTPVNKMISNVASYLIFLIILFLESNLDKRNQKRGPPNSGLEIIIIIYVIGYIWLNVRTCFKQGLKRFFSTMWHWFDTIMLLLFALTIVFWIASLVDITANNDVDLPRKYWNSLDPELIAEGLFAAAVIMAFFRLNLFLSLNYHLGPLQVSIGKMTLDIFRFIIIFFIIILAWCAGLCRFYQPYEGMVQKDAISGTTTTQVSSFVSFLMTLKTFFWAIFGMSPIESADVIIENLPGDTPDTTIINKHQFTEAVGYIAFALFQFLSVVVVLNMLVACMANTFTKVIDNVTVEWVFGRSQIYLSFMASSVLPPPFNLIPTASGIKDMFRWFRLLARPSDGQRAKCSLAHCCYIESETEAYVNNEFPSLMSELAQRYIRLKAHEETEQNNPDFDELRNEINEIKELLRKLNSSNICRRN